MFSLEALVLTIIFFLALLSIGAMFTFGMALGKAIIKYFAEMSSTYGGVEWDHNVP